MTSKYGPFKIVVIFFFVVAFIFANSCKEKYTPKPRSYFRIDFPEKSYHRITESYPYNFEIPDYSYITQDSDNPDKPFWTNIEVPSNKAEIHISYFTLNETEKGKKILLNELMEESRTLAYKHSIKADAITEQVFVNEGKKVYGLIYKIEGNAASPFQFFLTDSTTHFLRGALYIRDVPNIDSLKPVIDFLEPDVIRLIESASWN
jgi:gliding motility-associated lipoprotein GldD